MFIFVWGWYEMVEKESYGARETKVSFSFAPTSVEFWEKGFKNS